MSNDDPIIRFAKLRMVRHWHSLETALRKRDGGDIALEILYRLYDRMAESLGAICFLNVYDPKDQLKYVALSNEIKRYDEWLNAMRDIVLEGRAYDREIGDAEREDLLDLLMQTPEGQREAIDLGLIDPGPRDA